MNGENLRDVNDAAALLIAPGRQPEPLCHKVSLGSVGKCPYTQRCNRAAGKDCIKRELIC